MVLPHTLHDKCRVQGIVDKTLHKAELTIKHEADITTGEVYYDDIRSRGVFYLPFGSTETDKDNILNYLKNEFEDGLFLAKIKDIKVSVNKFTIKIAVGAEIPISLQGVSEFLESYSFIQVEEIGQIHNPEELIRLSEVILDTGSKIKGVEKLKEKLQKFLREN
jgi:hypothetical protein